jgi:hypothetical protein
VISEKQFALSYAGFWKQLLPLAEEYVRTTNRELGRFSPPLVSSLPSDTRGVVNEIGFRLFVAAATMGTSVDGLPKGAIGESVLSGLLHIRGLREHGRAPVPDPTAQQLDEAASLAKRLAEFFEKASPQSVIPFPLFRGCGWLDECAGDVLGQHTLFEVKAGERRFRSIDVRQVLIYCALNAASKAYDLSRVCFVNPRLGLFFEESIESLCSDAAGRPAMDVLNEIIQFVSEERDRYTTG